MAEVVRKIKSGKPIYRQQLARKREAGQLAAGRVRMLRRKTAHVLQSNGALVARGYAAKNNTGDFLRRLLGNE